MMNRLASVNWRFGHSNETPQSCTIAAARMIAAGSRFQCLAGQNRQWRRAMNRGSSPHEAPGQPVNRRVRIAAAHRFIRALAAS